MDEATGSPESDQNPDLDQDTGEDPKVAQNGHTEPHSGTDADADDAQTDSDTFSREYVEKLRRESAKYRDRASDRDALAERLHRALVEADGRLADAADLPYDEKHLDDGEALSEAITALLEDKPHYGARRLPSTDVGQGRNESGSTSITWADVLKQG